MPHEPYEPVHRHPHRNEPRERHDDRDQRERTPPIASEKVRTERKTFYLDLKENARGRMLQITEKNGERRNTVVIPAENLDEIAECLERLRAHNARL